ncbi:MAG TPA: inorganic phosphate transporter [Candidatus Tenderia electrophaga]|uniref:Phosphate transporter n=1 Tax=Candidatus Tenderia electrophaga TaxID=1748243 RepID=A0A832N458_9GAMM|nr:inorganic phosphate transporter [Candidatus Tenderia electrophaga]
MELEKIAEIEYATWVGRKELFRLGTALLFIIGIMLFTISRSGDVSHLLVVAAMIGGYMALNIGANDVANNVGPAVGSHALTLTGAILIAMIFEAAGALIAGGEVVGTIKKGIINPDLIANTDVFVWVMMAALLAGALWLNLATAFGAPVSTTHSIVGGVLGAGIAAGGWAIADWGKMGQIAASWVISPVLGGIIAAGFLYLVKRTITYRKDKIAAAKRMVPVLIGIMAWAFGAYLMLKGFKKIWKVDFMTALMIGAAVGLVVYFISRILVARGADGLENSKHSVNRMFTIPLIFAAALLSFAHGANDVANAVGPLAAINDALTHGAIAKKAAIPIWVMMVGAIGIAIGLALYGPKLIKTVGSEITELNQTRAFCIALSAAITVIIATHFGLPVSSTHIAVGAIFGVGFLREYLKASYARMVHEIELHHQGAEREEVEAFLAKFETASLNEKCEMLQQLKKHKANIELTKKERKSLKKTYTHELVKRSALLKIAAAWLITVPVSGVLAAILYFTIRGMML